MTLSSQMVSHSVVPDVTYPRVVIHKPTGHVILLNCAFSGFVIAINTDKTRNWQRKTLLGASWNIRTEANYETYVGDIIIQSR